MSSFIAYTIFGLFSGAAYAIAASGLVLTYTTTRVFNIAHGAFGMVLSFVFWDFSVRQGMPTWLALVLVLFVVAPAIGWFIARFVARGLGDAPVSVSLVVTVGLLVGCIGVAQQVYPPEARTVLPFFPDTSFHVGGTTITAHQLITIVASVAVAAGLYVLLNRTRIGTAMRASVDNPELLQLFGGKPDQVAALSWTIGISLAGLGGILLVSTVGLDYFQLTLLVINAYAAAMLGRLKSLPLTFVGAMGLGLLTSYAPGYLHLDGLLGQVQNVVPALFLFVVIVAMPQAQLRIGQVKGIVSAPLPSLPRTARLGRRAAAVRGAAGRLDVRGQPAAGRHRGDVRDRDAVAGAAHRLRRPRLAGPVHVRRRRCAGLRQARRAQPLRAAGLGAGRGRGRCPRGAAGAAADRPLPRAGHARVRLDHGQDGLPGRLRLRLQRHAAGRAALDPGPLGRARPAATSS